MIVVAFQLYDVNEGDGGLAVVPGAAAGAAILRAQKPKKSCYKPAGLAFWSRRGFRGWYNAVRCPREPQVEFCHAIGADVHGGRLEGYDLQPTGQGRRRHHFLGGHHPWHHPLVEPRPRAPLIALPLHARLDHARATISFCFTLVPHALLCIETCYESVTMVLQNDMALVQAGCTTRAVRGPRCSPTGWRS